MCVALISVLLYGCSVPGKTDEKTGAETETETEVLEVSVMKPDIKDISISSNFSGTVTAESEVNVIPLAAGEVIEKNFEVGDHVNAGDLLFKIDDEALQIAVSQAEASLTTAQAGLSTSKASAEATKAQSNATRASATKSVGEIPYNEQSANVAVDSSYVSKRSANNTYKNALDGIDQAESTLEDKKKARDAANSARDSAKTKYDQLVASGTASAAEIAAAKTEYENYQTTAETAEKNVKSAEYSLDSAKRSADNAEMSYKLSQENYALSEMQRDNYNTYTKPTTIYSAYASAVQANASDVGADNSITTSAAQVKQAQAGLDSAKLNLEHATVTAPVSGTITAINVSLHNMATTSTAAYTIQSDEQNKISFYAAEETVNNIKPGSEATVTKNGMSFPAKIINVYDTIDPNTGLFKVELMTTDPNSGSMVPGSTVSIKTVTRRADKAISVPIDAVYYDGEQAFLYVEEGGNAKRLNVTAGISDEESVEIIEGLTADANVIVTWSGNLRDGVPVSVTGARTQSSEAAAAGPDTGAATPATGTPDNKSGNGNAMVPISAGAGDD